MVDADFDTEKVDHHMSCFPLNTLFYHDILPDLESPEMDPVFYAVKP